VTDDAPNGVENAPDTPEGKDFPQAEDVGNTYRGDYIVLMPRDPEWLHAYWEIPAEGVENALAELGVAADEAEFQLRLHNVTDLIESGSGRPRLEDSDAPVTIKVDAAADHWYIKAGGAEQIYCVEYAIAAPDGRSVQLALSNLATTPADEAAEPTEETWVTAQAGQGEVTTTPPSEETKWMEGHEHLHEALSSAAPDETAEDSSPSDE